MNMKSYITTSDLSEEAFLFGSVCFWIFCEKLAAYSEVCLEKAQPLLI